MMNCDLFAHSQDARLTIWIVLYLLLGHLLVKLHMISQKHFDVMYLDHVVKNYKKNIYYLTCNLNMHINQKNLVLDLGKGKTIDLKWKGKHLFHGINGMCLPEKVRQSFEFVKGSVTTAKGLYELSFTGPKSFSTERNTAKHFMDTGVKSFGFMLKINLGKHTTGHSPADVKSISVFSEENEVLLYDMSKVEILAVEYWGDYEAQCDPERIASTYQLGDISCLKSFSLRDISCKNKHGGPIENQGSFLFRPLLVRHSVHIGYENILND
eukprot:742027_1